MDIDQQIMQLALEQARIGLGKGELPIGAIVALNTDIVSRAHTQAEEMNRLLAHADLLALSDADGLGLDFDDRRRLTLYVNLEPCLMCLGAAMSVGVGRIVYGLKSALDGGLTLLSREAGSVELFPGYRFPQVAGGVDASSTVSLLMEFLGKRKASDRYTVWAQGLLNAI